MNRIVPARSGALILAGLLVAACSSAGGTAPDARIPPATAGTDPTAPVAAPIRLALEVHRSPGCSCCHEWEAYVQAAGWSVRAADDADIAALKARYGLPRETWSCHTTIVAGYVIEGHVPMEAIEDLLTRRPAIDGIALPAMPAGSPGMPGVKAGPFDVLAIADGQASLFGRY